MTDLIDRIRAYVAAIPTHYCKNCGTTAQSQEDGCWECEAIDRVGDLDVLPETAADALLREVAALEPAGYIWPSAVYVLQSGERTHEVLWAKPTGQAGHPLYTLTGATHE